ncbi:MAG: imidazole glycerol phosphate synthase subunit HisH [Alphaproteobacteria bacterium]|nr:MAG: imidazole glycerol phosphate synthase subunit HisH [Alphaproteobacteria bacterium]
MTVAIVDYGSGNLRSAAKAFERQAAGREVMVTGRAEDLARADHIVLPGVGAFGDCVRGLRALAGMIEALEENVVCKAKPFLGICVGMQLMARRGLEHGIHEGLGWIDGEVVPLAPTGGGEDHRFKVPHMGWNELSFRDPPHPIFAGLAPGAHAYFVHGYRFAAADAACVLAEVSHGGPVTAAIGRDNMVGTQFHPEKSQAVGLSLIANFLAWRP